MACGGSGAGPGDSGSLGDATSSGADAGQPDEGAPEDGGSARDGSSASDGPGANDGAGAGHDAASGAPGTPAIVQHVSSSSSRGNTFASPYCYTFQLPDPATAGNAIIVGFTYDGTAAAAVTDDKGNKYAIAESTHDSAHGRSVGIAAAFGITGGARVVDLCFSADPNGTAEPMATEIAGVVALDGPGAGASGHGTSAAAGSLTPTANGDLVYQVVASESMAQSSFAAPTRLLSADVLDGLAAQWFVSSGTAAVDPTMTLGTSDDWISAAVLLKAGSAGAVPGGMRVAHLLHENIPYHTSAGGSGDPFANPLPLQVPCSGNLLVAMIGGGNGPEYVTSIDDTAKNTWTQAGNNYSQGDATVQVFYAAGLTSSLDLGVNVHWGGNAGDYTIFFYDVVGAAPSPLDTTVGGGAAMNTAGSLMFPFTLTPAQANEIVLSEVMWDYNTGSGLSGQLFDTNTFSGESQSGPEPVDENNGWGHVVTTSTSPVTFTWTTLFAGLPVGSWAGMAAAFKAAR